MDEECSKDKVQMTAKASSILHQQKFCKDMSHMLPPIKLILKHFAAQTATTRIFANQIDARIRQWMCLCV